MAQIKTLVIAFLHWWAGELRACLPARLRRLLFAARNRLTFEIADRLLVVSEANGAGERELARFPIPGPGEGDGHRTADRVRHFLNGLDGRRRDIVVRLPAAAALKRKIELPLAAEENLREVVAFDMERQTPFSADQVYFDVRIVRRLPERQRVLAELVLVPKTLADPAISSLASWAVVPHFIELPGAVDGQSRLVALKGEFGGAPVTKGVRRASWALAGLATVLTLAIVAVPLIRQQRTLEDLDARVIQAKKGAEAARKTQEQIDNLAALDHFLVERKEARPVRLAVLDEISRILPDDTWLFRLRLTGDEVQTFGYSAGASNLIGPIEESSMFRNPQFLAPLMRDQRVDAERFHIAFQLEGGQG